MQSRLLDVAEAQIGQAGDMPCSRDRARMSLSVVGTSPCSFIIFADVKDVKGRMPSDTDPLDVDINKTLTWRMLEPTKIIATTGIRKVRSRNARPELIKGP